MWPPSFVIYCEGLRPMYFLSENLMPFSFTPARDHPAKSLPAPPHRQERGIKFSLRRYDESTPTKKTLTIPINAICVQHIAFIAKGQYLKIPIVRSTRTYYNMYICLWIYIHLCHYKIINVTLSYKVECIIQSTFL